MIIPPYLKSGDKVAITCPAKKLPHSIDDAVQLLTSWGLEVILGDTVTAGWKQFAGTDEERAADMQRFLDDDSIKAIFAARGGYGTIRIIDALDFTPLNEHPKWLIGFSDITVLHSHIQQVCGMASIHGQMPLTIPDGTKPSLLSLRNALFGEEISYDIKPHELNRVGSGKGLLTGGNLALICALTGSVSEADFTGKILFLEDVGEYLYNLDRMMHTLKRSGKLEELEGLIVGGFTELKDNDVPFGFTAEEIIKDAVSNYPFPVAFNFPAGHVPDNHSLLFGLEAHLQVDKHAVKLNYVPQTAPVDEPAEKLS
ncbi:MAG: LD-carboxypeptidase [Mucilaginibacter polytrichastri]|nr:LD-carboxypeptidase [Mucilaginibacter polytrichastri]